ncbi:MAG: polyphosphate kinase 1 [Treponema sp.]|nr:polyphosphate kinase 1 [Treponema sp.]MCL2272623.1 polyphosphate kinase 1 [Treponema sp.]
MEKNEQKETAIPCLSRDLSWVNFNERVLNEGLRRELPLLERIRFLSIVSTNFDEFFMIRVAALKRLAKTETGKSIDICGLTAEQQLREISLKVHSIIKKQYDCLREEIFPGLAKNGLSLLRPDSWSVPQLDFLDTFFAGHIYPVLTPLRLEPDKPMPFIESRSLNAAFLLEPDRAPSSTAADVHDELKVVVPLPKILNRLVWLPGFDNMSANAEGDKEKFCFALLEDVIVTWGGYLFPGYRIKESMVFKINRDADFSVDEQRDEDFVEAMVEVLEGRERADVIRMVYSPGSDKLRDELARRYLLADIPDSNESFRFADDYLYEVDGPINPVDFMELSNAASFEDLIEKPWKIYKSADFNEETSIWDRISQGDCLLHLPYQSFDPVIRFFQDAASDPQVVSIRTALYRTGGAIPGIGINSGSSGFSPVVRALEQAALNGKHVTAVVELKARFDEERNISWANRLEKAGVIVVYGLSNLKVHSKITMVMRRENERIKRYVHLSTGNYNYRTAKYYEDICLFTCREDIAYDAGLIFNMLTGYSVVQQMMRLTIAPAGLKRRFLELIEREANRAKHEYPSRIMAKMNALTDIDIIKALYAASRAGVKISLCVRGICTLIPGIPDISENIRVISVVDHYLEHSRIYYFSNGGAEELYLASADWMLRNLEKRVEILFPVQDEKLRAELIDVLNAYFRDNCQASLLDRESNWTRLVPAENESLFRVQKEMHSRAAGAGEIPGPAKMEYTVRRSPQAVKNDE